MREILSMNADWKFHDGGLADANYNCIAATEYENPQWLKSGNNAVSRWGYDDRSWSDVRLPHDFVIERCEFSSVAPARQGSLTKGIVWYRKCFSIPETDRGRHFRIEFDGVYRDCEVWMNGHFLGRVLSGYQSFGLDLDDILVLGGPNVVAVRVDATGYEGWWYEGGGIYRDVRLVKTHAVHIVQWGTFVRSTVLPDGSAEVEIETTVSNTRDCGVSFRLSSIVRRDIDSSTDAPVLDATGAFALGPHETGSFKQRMHISNPLLWTIEQPLLYRMDSVILVDGQSGEECLDTFETTFGIRTIGFDPDVGFILNGENIKIRGVCCHEDHAGVGVAVPREIFEYRVRLLKQMGCNAYRTSHNPPTPHLLDVCDRLGMVVMVENRLMDTAEDCIDQLQTLIRRDRNHPCVAIWSLGNEEMVVQGTDIGVRIMTRLRRVVKSLDPTRPVTCAMNGDWEAYTTFHEEHGFHVDLSGLNYNLKRDWESYDRLHERFPRTPIIGTENGSTMTTRGLYHREDYVDGLSLYGKFRKITRWASERRNDIVSGYGEVYPVWGGTPEETWTVVDDRPFVAGLFLWTGFDYRGETTPYSWPAVASNFGLLDLCGFPKDPYYYYQSWWTDSPVLHLFPHWDWADHEGEPIDVWCFSNLDEVELSLNGTSMGRRRIRRNEKATWEVLYRPGTLRASGYKNGKLVSETVRETTKGASQIRMTSHKATMTADNEDLVVVEVAVTDSEGNVVPAADHEIAFDIEGPGRLLGVGNGHPASHERVKSNRRKAFHGLCMAIVQSTMAAGWVVIRAESDRLQPCRLAVESTIGATKPFVPSIDRQVSERAIREVRVELDRKGTYHHDTRPRSEADEVL